MVNLKRHFIRRTFMAGLLALGIYNAIPSCKSDPFVDTGNKTSLRYHIFDYSGGLEDAVGIAEEFDVWDEERGDLCANVGSRNIRLKVDKVQVAANCDGPVAYEVKPANPKKEAKKPVVERNPPLDYTRIDYNNSQIKKDLKERKYDKKYLSALEDMCEELDMHCMGLLSTMHFESGGSFKSSEKNRAGGTGTGPIQITERTAGDMGTTTQYLASLSQVEYLKWVKDYFNLQRGRYPSVDYSNPVNIAAAIFYPASLKGGDDYPIAREGSLAYDQNRNLDVDEKGNPKKGNGVITKKEYVQRALDPNSGYL